MLRTGKAVARQFGKLTAGKQERGVFS